MFRAFIASLLLIISLSLSSCASGIASLQSYSDAYKGYQFLYPNGWVEVEVNNASEGVDVVFRDIIERSENLSLIVSQVPEDKDLTDLGSPSDVGYRLLKAANATSPDRDIELISAEAKEDENQTYYILEYAVTLPNNQKRHNLASVAVRRGQLFTFNISTIESRWQKIQNTFRTVVNSFTLTY
jgi:photosystem II oxygen-evolving enhancer protein 2